MIKEEIIFQNNKINSICSSCDKYGHTILNCNLIIPIFNKIRTSLKFANPISQSRYSLIRERGKINTLYINSIVRICLKKIRNNMVL